MKKQNGLTKKVLFSLLAAGMMSTLTAGSVLAAIPNNVIGTVKVDNTDTDVATKTGTFSIGEAGKTLSIENGKGDAIGLFQKGDSLTLKGSEITIKSTTAQGINAGATEQTVNPYATVVVGDSNTNKISINSKYTGVQGIHGHVTLTAKEIDVTSTNEAAVWLQNCTELATAPEGATSLTITADKVNLKGAGWGVIAFSNSQININGNTTIEGTNAIDVRGNSTVNINTDGKHTTNVTGDVVFETPNTPTDAKNSGKIINSYLTLNLTGKDSEWTGKSYQEYEVDGKYEHIVELKEDPYHGNVTGFNLTIADGAKWYMNGDSFVNTATVKDGGVINVDGAVKTFNAASLTLDGGNFTAIGGKTTVNNFNASGDSTVDLTNATFVMDAGSASLKEIKASGTSFFTGAENAVKVKNVTVTKVDGVNNAFLKVSGGAAVSENITVGDGATIELTGDKNSAYTVGGNIATGKTGKVVLSGGTLTKNDIKDTFTGTGTLEIKDNGILSTKSDQIYTNKASEKEKDSGAIANTNITFTGGKLNLTDDYYTVGYLDTAQKAIAKTEGKTTLVMSGKLVTESGETDSTGENTVIGTETIEKIDSSTQLDKVTVKVEENLLVGSVDSSATNKEIDGVTVKDQVANGFAVASLELPAAQEGDAQVGVVITNDKDVTLGGSAGGDVITVAGDKGETKTEVKVVVGTKDKVAGADKTAGTLNIGNALATADTKYTLTGEAVLNGASTLNVNGETTITKTVTLTGTDGEESTNVATVNVNKGSLKVNEGVVLSKAAVNVAEGATLETTTLAVKDASTLTGSTKVTDKVTVDAGKVLNIGSGDKAGELVVKDIEGGIVFLDPVWENGATIGDASGVSIGKDEDTVTIKSALVAGNNSKISVGAELSAADAAFAKTGLTWGSDVNAAAYIGKTATLDTNGSLTLDGSITDKNFSTEMADTPAGGTLTLAANSILMVDGSKVEGTTATAAISGVTKLTIDAKSKLFVDNAERGKTYKILTGDGVKAADTLWATNNIFTDNKLLDFIRGKDQDGNYSVVSQVTTMEDAYGKGAIIAPDVFDKANDEGKNALEEFAMEAAKTSVNATTEAQVSAFNSVAALSEVAGSARGAYTAAGLVNSAVADHMSLVHEYTHDKDVWAKYIHNKEDVDGLSIAGFGVAYKNQYNGIVVGADLYHNEKATVGVALTYGDGDITGSTLAAYTKNDTKYYGATIYGGIHNGDTAFLGDISYLHSKNDITQQNSGKTITGSESGNAFSIGVRAEQSVKAGHGQFVPYVGLRYMHLSNGSYTDSLGMSHDGGDMNLWLLPVGVKYSVDAKHGSWTLRPVAEIGYVWNMGDRDARETVSFDGTTNSFGYDVTDNGSYLGHLGFEAEKGNTTFGIGYQYQKGDSVRSNRWTASVNYRF